MKGNSEMSNANHPAHYNIPGRKECIIEMLEIFGSEKVQAFCELNAYKYRYRHQLKNGQEDLDKAEWYDAKRAELIATDERFEIARNSGLDIRENFLIEEMAELTQAIYKCKRFRYSELCSEYPKNIDKEAAKNNLIEEIADVRLVLEQLIYLLGCEKAVAEAENQKIKRTLERMGGQNENN